MLSSLAARAVGTPEEASEILRVAGRERRVGVFGRPHAAELQSFMTSVPLAVAQLHGDSSPKAVMAAQGGGSDGGLGCRASVGRVAGRARRTSCFSVPTQSSSIHVGPMVSEVPDDRSTGTLSREVLDGLERRARLVVAGGLNPANVAGAIRTLRPDIVDVSSGVESAPGVKDPILMRRFVEAARSA